MASVVSWLESSYLFIFTVRRERKMEVSEETYDSRGSLINVVMERRRMKDMRGGA